jgi:hypothetical protein
MSFARTESELGACGAYVDTSAYVKLILDEPESVAMEEVFRHTPLTSSAVLVTELLRTVLRDCPDRTDHAIDQLDHLITVPVKEDVVLAAGLIGAPVLRSLPSTWSPRCCSIPTSARSLLTTAASQR